MRALSSYVSPSSGGGSPAETSPISQPGQGTAELVELVRVARGEDERAFRAAAVSQAARWAVPSSVIPAAARSSSSSSSSRVNGSRSAVACTSTRRPSPAITTFMSVSADESSM